MPKQKYDWNKIKLEFFQSDFDEVSPFLKERYGENMARSNLKNYTKGWGKDKQAYKQKILERALKENLKKQAKELEIDVETLMKGKKNALVGIMNDLTKNSERLSMSDRVKGLNALKTELGEPTSIGKTDAVIKDETTDQNPLKEKLLKLKQNNQGNISSGQKKK